MKALIRLIAVLALAAIFLFPGSALVFASEDWVVYMSVTRDPDIGGIPGEGSHFGFGAKDGASDGYDSAEGDEIAPPDPMAGINAYFYYPANPPFQKNLIVSVTGPATSMIWPLVIKTVGETGDAEMTLSWPDISSVPVSYIVLELQDTEGTTLADMRSVDHYSFSASQGQTYNFQIKAEVEEILQYDVTIDSTDGGRVTTPGEGVFTYDEGTVVDLAATPGFGYLFDDWTGDVGTIAHVNAATTTITMNGDYSITASFVANTPPELSTVFSTQRNDGSGTVDISYNVSDDEQSTVTVSLEYWDGSWHSCTNTAGDVGPGINTGTGKAATWDAKAQLGATYISFCKVRVTADDGAGGTDSEESNTFDLDTAPPMGYGCTSPEDEAECVPIDEALLCSIPSDDSTPIEYKFAVASDMDFSQDLQESGWQQSTNWTPTTALSCGTAYWWKVKARDAKNNESDWSSPFAFVTIYKFDLVLKSGWNMISLPLESCTGETDPGVLLPDVEAIYTWNCETMSYNSPSEIVPGKGYWALVFEDVTETIYGTPVEEYQLSSDCEGWHMVGSLYVDGQVNVGSGSVYGSLYYWNPETLSYIARPLDEVRPGEGYCLLAFTNFSISVVPKPPVP